MVAAFGTSNDIEYIFIIEIVDLTWEIHRYTRWKADILNVAAQKADGASKGQQQMEEAIKAWGLRVPGEPKVETRIPEKQVVQQTAPTSIHYAVAFEQKIETFERMNKLQAQLETRRNNLMGEIEYCRRAFVRSVCDNADRIIDGDFMETPVAPK